MVNNINEMHKYIASLLNAKLEDIQLITKLNKGMTNDTYIFEYKNNQYIIRIPGKGSEKLIDRYQEGKVYSALKGKNICENIIYYDETTGCKIAEFYQNARVCNPHDKNDISLAINKLKEFDNLNLQVDFEFNIFEKIESYEKLFANKSKYNDYVSVKNKIYELKPFIEDNVQQKTLTHIDFVYDNILIINNEVKLIDWEYAGMQDPHVDIAMFCIYAMYDKQDVDMLIDMYFDNKCSQNNRIKIYCYIAICGLLWSNWCEYKESIGVVYGEYAKKQYEYAKEYSKMAYELIIKGECNEQN